MPIAASLHAYGFEIFLIGSEYISISTTMCVCVCVKKRTFDFFFVLEKRKQRYISFSLFIADSLEHKMSGVDSA